MSATPKRRWFRYSLRSLLVLMTLLCIALGWYFNSVHDQRVAVAAMRAGNWRFEYGGSYFQDKWYMPQWLGEKLPDDLCRDVIFVRAPSDAPEWEVVTRLRRVKKIELIGDPDEKLDQISHMTSVEDLSLEISAVTDAGLRRLAPLTSLKRLNLSNTEVTGDGFDALSGLTQLTDLSLVGCGNLSHTGLAQIANLHSLERLDLRSCPRITDEGIRQLNSLAGLKELRLRGCYITGAGLTSIATLPKLAYLDLGETAITDESLGCLESAAALTDLNLSQCKGVTGIRLEVARKLTRLERLNL